MVGVALAVVVAPLDYDRSKIIPGVKNVSPTVGVGEAKIVNVCHCRLATGSKWSICTRDMCVVGAVGHVVGSWSTCASSPMLTLSRTAGLTLSAALIACPAAPRRRRVPEADQPRCAASGVRVAASYGASTWMAVGSQACRTIAHAMPHLPRLPVHQDAVCAGSGAYREGMRTSGASVSGSVRLLCS